MGVQIRPTDDPSLVLEVAGTFLASRPVEHNLVLSLLRARVADPQPGRYWIASDAGSVVGVGFQSPVDFTVTMTPLPPDAAEALAAALVDPGGRVPGVQAEAATAARVAGAWTELTGTAASPRMGMRIYALQELVGPPGVDGELRVASPDDVEVVLGMLDGFARDTGEHSPMSEADQLARLSAGTFRLWWVDGEPRSMCARTEVIEGAARVFGVYTPPEVRGRGYAAAAVTELSAEILAEGATPMLYTDLGNPTSNAVYRRIGYRAVAENLRYDFS